MSQTSNVNLDELPYVIYAFVVLHNFGEIHNESINEESVRMYLIPIIWQVAMKLNESKLDEYSRTILTFNISTFIAHPPPLLTTSTAKLLIKINQHNCQ
jgi:NhaP-type Na+/H+ or K+/H+ antiporter